MKKLFLFVISAFISFTVFAQVSEEERMANYMDESRSEVFSDFGFDSIKVLPKNKNAIRMCSSKWSEYDIIELAWTKSSASVVYLKEADIWEDPDDQAYKKKQKEVKNQDVKKILNLIQKTNFYNQQRYIIKNKKEGERSEGETFWYVEANIDGEYKSVSRWNPDGTFLKTLGYALYDLTKD